MAKRIIKTAIQRTKAYRNAYKLYSTMSTATIAFSREYVLAAYNRFLEGENEVCALQYKHLLAGLDQAAIDVAAKEEAN